MDMPLLPKPLQCLLKGLLEEHRLSSWSSEWTDGDVNVIIKFSPLPKNNRRVQQDQPITGKLIDTPMHCDSSSDSDDDTLVSRGVASLSVTNPCEEGTLGKPRRYHLLELGNIPDKYSNEPQCISPDPSSLHCMGGGVMMNEEKMARGMTASISSSSEEYVTETEINLREFGNTYCSTSAENSSPEGYDEVDNLPLKIYNENNVSDTTDKYDATRLVDITE